eukprot:TRINITY_DN1390_c0_g13_i3.p2 TRINITY_DN1390_c0_g13~~TRINITY_DN1390_c0_g13_i3.p2  ORF type:complete len:539 (-),score=232.86 TRINITY_DN1390_c0_g13_i3:2506-4122(-)
MEFKADSEFTIEDAQLIIEELQHENQRLVNKLADAEHENQLLREELDHARKQGFTSSPASESSSQSRINGSGSSKPSFALKFKLEEHNNSHSTKKSETEKEVPRYNAFASRISSDQERAPNKYSSMVKADLIYELRKVRGIRVKREQLIKETLIAMLEEDDRKRAEKQPHPQAKRSSDNNPLKSSVDMISEEKRKMEEERRRLEEELKRMEQEDSEEEDDDDDDDDEKPTSSKRKPSPLSSDDESYHKKAKKEDDDASLETRLLAVTKPTTEGDENKLYCLCNKPFAGETMIECDQCTNWFHPECVGLTETTIPEGSYICPPCQEKSKKKDSASVEDDRFRKYTPMTKKELREELGRRGLIKKGVVVELIQRLVEDDEKQEKKKAKKASKKEQAEAAAASKDASAGKNKDKEDEAADPAMQKFYSYASKYINMTKKELQALLAERDLAKTGSVVTLIHRLSDYDRKKDSDPNFTVKSSKGEVDDFEEDEEVKEEEEEEEEDDDDDDDKDDDKDDDDEDNKMEVAEEKEEKKKEEPSDS